MSAPPDLEAKARDACDKLAFHSGMRPGYRHDPACMWCASLIAFAERVQRETVERCETIVKDACPCTCISAYTDRGMVAPDCFKHQACYDAADAIRAAFAEPGKEGK